MKKEITKEMEEKLINAYHGNKDALYEVDDLLNQNGVLDNGVSDIHDTYEMGYNNAMQHVFSVLDIVDYETNTKGEKHEC